MKPVSKEVLKTTANSLMFDMTDAEYDDLLSDFALLCEQMKIFDEIEGLDDAEMMVFPFEVTNSFLREDDVTSMISKTDALKNCEDVEDGQVRLPRVVK